MSIILDEVKNIIRQIDKDGIKINGTKEIQNVISEFYIDKLAIKKEETEIKKYYNKFIGNYDDRLALEADHYNFLKSFVIHKIKENQYFFKIDKNDFSSRKNIIWSQDCIGCIHILIRPKQNILNVFIRSSDAVNLLVVDYLHMIKLFKSVLSRYDIKETKNDLITFFTTSSHFYIKDLKKVKKILK